ncbi:TonB family protein [Rhodoferax sp. AJA081-3]|nr:TonB family protein [Rhodoferax sp. AJA081-3]
MPPAKTASEPSAMERSKRQSENVYRFIKQFADTPRKPAAPVVAPAAVRPKEEVATPAPPARRPDTQNLAIPASTLAATPDAAPTTAPVNTATSESTAPAPAASAAPATATPPVATASAAPAAPAVEDDEEELQLVEQVQPQFPRGMQGATDSGKVTVAFTVQPDGSVTDTSIVSASNRRFGKPARDAVAQWRFAPIKAARAVQVEIAFSQQ